MPSVIWNNREAHIESAEKPPEEDTVRQCASCYLVLHPGNKKKRKQSGGKAVAKEVPSPGNSLPG